MTYLVEKRTQMDGGEGNHKRRGPKSKRITNVPLRKIRLDHPDFMEKQTWGFWRKRT